MCGRDGSHHHLLTAGYSLPAPCRWFAGSGAHPSFGHQLASKVVARCMDVSRQCCQEHRTAVPAARFVHSSEQLGHRGQSMANRATCVAGCLEAERVGLCPPYQLAESTNRKVPFPCIRPCHSLYSRSLHDLVLPRSYCEAYIPFCYNLI